MPWAQLGLPGFQHHAPWLDVLHRPVQRLADGRDLCAQVLAEAGVFHLRLCKLCDDGVVVKGEYGLTAALFEKGFNIGTLMSKYPAGLDWRDQQHWNCNNNVHPSRHGELSLRPSPSMPLGSVCVDGCGVAVLRLLATEDTA